MSAVASNYEQMWRETQEEFLSSRAYSRQTVSELFAQWVAGNQFSDLNIPSESDSVDYETTLKISSNTVEKVKLSSGLRFFQKRVFIQNAVKELMFSHFARACDFPYAPVRLAQIFSKSNGMLIDDEAVIVTPALSENASSLLEMAIYRARHDDSDMPNELQTILINPRFNQYMASPHQKDLIDDYLMPYYQANMVFLSKMVALGLFANMGDLNNNPGNIIVNRDNPEHFLYAIDLDPTFRFLGGRQGKRQLRRMVDPEVFQSMQTTIKEKVTDDLIKEIGKRAGALTDAWRPAFRSEVGLSSWEEEIDSYLNSARSVRDTPYTYDEATFTI